MVLKRSVSGFLKKGIVSYTLFLTTTSPSRALKFIFICLFFCWLFYCSCWVYNILLWNETFYSIGNCLEVPEPTKQQCGGSWWIIWGEKRAEFFSPVTHNWNSIFFLQFFLPRITFLLSLSVKQKKLLHDFTSSTAFVSIWNTSLAGGLKG